MNEKKPPVSTTWQHESFTSALGKWTWIITFISGLINFIYGLYWTIYFLGFPYGTLFIGYPLFELIAGILVMLISFAIIKPKISSKCASKDWDAIYNWHLKLGSFKLPWMLVWGIIISIFSWYYWGGVPIFILFILLYFMGPKEYKWSE